MVIADDSRDWKGIQRHCVRLDRDKTLEAQEAAGEKAYGAERDRLRQDLASAQREILEHGKTLAKLNRKLTDLDPKLYAADQNAKFLKASFDAARYKYEDDLANRPQSAPKSKRDLDRLEKSLNEANLKLARLKKDQADTDAEIKRITARRDDVRVSIEKLSADYKLARQKTESLRQDTIFTLRNSPILDMVNPSLRVQ